MTNVISTNSTSAKVKVEFKFYKFWTFIQYYWRFNADFNDGFWEGILEIEKSSLKHESHCNLSKSTITFSRPNGWQWHQIEENGVELHAVETIPGQSGNYWVEIPQKMFDDGHHIIHKQIAAAQWCYLYSRAISDGNLEAAYRLREIFY